MLKSTKSLILLSSLLLVACGGTTNSQANSSNNSNSATNSNSSSFASSTNDKSSTMSTVSSSNASTSSSKATSSTTSMTSSSTSKDNDEVLTLKMFGDVYKDGMRTVYALIKEGHESDVAWETSDPTVVAISPRTDITTECSLMGKNYGTATITAYLTDDPTQRASIQVTISEGEAMPADLFNKVTGGMKLTSDDKCLSFDASLNSSVDEHYSITTIYEEINPTNTDESNTTDGYQMSVIDLDTNRETYYANYVKGLGNYVSTEYLDIYNEIESEKYVSIDSEEGVKWDSSYYCNLWANEDIATNEMFRTFDGGKTYHYTSFYLNAIYLCASMYLLDLSPDDMYFTYENDVLQLHVDVDPYNRDATASTLYGRKIVTTFSEFDTATIDHPEVYPHEDIHDDIDAAKEKIVAAKNYTVEYSLDYPGVGDDLLYKFTFTEDTIDQVVERNGTIVSHTGAHKTGASSYFQYGYNDSTNTLTMGNQYNSPWESENIDRYPTFDFASEIFESTGNNTYVTKGDLGLFISRCLYLNSSFNFYNFSNPGTLVLDDAGNIKTISTTVDALGDDLFVSATFSNIGTTVCNIDFDSINDSNLPSSFEEQSTIVYNALVSWGIIDVVPYLYCKVNYDSVAYARPRDENGFAIEGVAYTYIETKAFESAEDRDQFIADYKALLLNLGYEDTGVDEKDTGYRLYQKGDYSIGVGINPNWAGKDTLEVKIIIVSEKLVNPGL